MKSTQPPAPPDECDLVMQGGLTSGVAYPAAAIELHKRYRFRSIGGASVGAMAAVVTAAAEYARDTGGFTRLAELRTQLQKPGLIASLFQPYREAAPLVHLLLAVQAQRAAGAKARTYISRLLLWTAPWILGALVVAFGLTVAFLADSGISVGDLGAGSWIIVAVLLLVAGFAGFITAMVFFLRRMIRSLPGNYFGLCSGRTSAKSRGQGLTDWLYATVQCVAGKELDDPLTFDDLAVKGIRLQLMTTDVSGGRPLRMPNRPAGPRMFFAPEELSRLLPEKVVDYMVAKSTIAYSATADTPELRFLPETGLPVIVAARMSLGFPILLSAVPLWVADSQNVTRHWFADGGISSNFPIQLFDEWLPTRPTFGLYFGDSLPSPADDRSTDARPRSVSVGVSGYIQKIIQTALTWHDTLQAGLPGFRERVHAIPLSPGQGGFNLVMSANMLADLDAHGKEAGRALNGFDFSHHWIERYTLLMRMVQRGLVRPSAGHTSVAQAYPPSYRDWLASGLPGDQPPYGTDQRWCAEAADATDELLRAANEWLPTQGSFVMGADPEPPATMRVTPDL